MSLPQEQFGLNVFDYSLIPYCVVEILLDENKEPINWIYRYCNQAFADTKGYRLDAMINHSISNLTLQIDRQWLNVYYQAAYKNKPYEMDLLLEELHHVIIMPIGKKGFCSCMICPATKLENEGLKKDHSLSKERIVLNKLLPEYVSLYRIELNSGKYEILRIASNTNARKLVDKDPKPLASFDEYTKRYADAFILDEDKEEFMKWHACENMKKLLSTTDKITYHYQSVSKDGKRSFYEAFAVRAKADEKKFYVFLGYRNIDSILYKEKEIQEKLKKALEEVKLSNEIISAVAKTYQYISRIDIQADWFEQITNRTLKNLEFLRSGVVSEGNKRMAKQAVAEEYQEAFLKFTDLSTLPDRMKNEESIAMEYRMKDGSWHKLRFIEKKRDETGRLTHVLCAIRSISDTKKKEQDLLYQVAEAKRDAALKTKFLSNMSHDIRTPMNGIIGMIELANHYPNDVEMLQKCRDKILELSKYLVSLVSDILAMSKLESDEDLGPAVPFDLAELLSKVNAEKQTLAKKKKIDYVIDWEKGGLTHSSLSGNPVYLEKMLNTIADNAVKFTNPSGSVRVWCKEKSAEDKRVIYEFGCSDTGIGMSEQFIAHAFDMFSQENETSRSNYEGTGLGLAIAKKIADKMDGTIEIKSKKGIGTTVIMTIPFQIAQPETVERINLRREISLEGKRALVVEDNELNMEIAQFILEENGLLAECAMDGREAIKKFEASAIGYYDVILMDIMMPNMNGWDTARTIRAMKRADAKRIPIIAMSANAFAEDIINSRIAGMNQHITKPLDANKLLAELRECM